MHKLTITCCLVLAGCVLTGCTDSKPGVTAPTTTFAVVGPSFSVTPIPLTAQPVAGASCPVVSPFNVAFTLSVQAGSSSVLLTDLAMRFVDTQGVQMPQITLPAPLPTTQFGTALVDARTAHDFPLLLPIGCGTGHDGTLIVIVGTLDGLGRASSTQITAMVH